MKVFLDTNVWMSATVFSGLWEAAELIADHAEPPEDNDRRLVNAAAAAGAELFVTGDKRVLDWQTVAGVPGLMRIASPRDAWGILAAGGAGH